MEKDNRAESMGRRQRKLDDVFGELLPDITSDERERAAEQPDKESWYFENRPPHHGS